MREQKYRDILEKYEEVNPKTIEEESEEKLSMTREMKFKDLQDSLVEEKKVKEDLTMTREIKFLDKVKEASVVNVDEDFDEEEIEVDKESTLKESADIERELDEALERELKKQKNLQVKEVHESEKKTKSTNSIDDDIYLTTSFKPFKKRFKFRKVFKIFFILLIILVGFGALTYYVVLPVYHKFIDSKPKMIFDHTIDYLDKQAENIIDTIFTDENIYYNDINFKLDTNIDELDLLSDNTFGYRVSVNPNAKTYEDFVYIKENNEEYGLHYIEKDAKAYINLTGSSSYLDVGEVDDEDNDYYNLISDYLDEISLSRDELKTLLNKEFSIIKDLLEEDLISSKKDELEVNGKTIKVVKNSFTVGKKDIERLSKKYYELVKEDEKLVEILAESEELDKEEYLKQLEEGLTKKYEDDYNLIISIYTVNGTKFAGFDIEENGFRLFYYYLNDNNDFDFYMNLTENEECLKGKDCVASNRDVYELYGHQEDKTYEVSIKYNSIEYAKLNIDSFDDKKIKFDYSIFVEEKTINGDFLLYLDNDKKEYNIDLSVKMDNQYANLKLFLGLKYDGQFKGIDEKNVAVYTDQLSEKEWNEFGELLESHGLSEGFTFWYLLNYEPEELLKELGFETFIPSGKVEDSQNSESQTV